MPDMRSEIQSIIESKMSESSPTSTDTGKPVASSAGPTEAELESVEEESGSSEAHEHEEDLDGEENVDSEVAPPDAPEKEEPADPEPERKPPPPKSWSAMFRKERALRERETQLSARQQQLESRENEAKKVLEALEKDPYAFVEERGFNYDKWAQRRLRDGAPEPMDEVGKLRSQLEAMQKSQQEASERARQEVAERENVARANAWVAQVPQTLQDPKYTIIKDWGAENEVTAVAAKALTKTGRWLTQAEAADLIVGEIEATLANLEKSGRISRVSRAAPKQPVAQSPQAPGQANSKRETGVSPPKKRKRPRTQREEIEALAKNLRML